MPFDHTHKAENILHICFPKNRTVKLGLSYIQVNTICDKQLLPTDPAAQMFNYSAVIILHTYMGNGHNQALDTKAYAELYSKHTKK